MISSSKFRKAIDALVHRKAKEVRPGHGRHRSIQDIVESLPPEPRRRFEEVRVRCLEMRTIAHGVRGRTGLAAQPAEDLSTPALDRLLWVFLRLLVSQEALNRFLQRTNPDEIRARLGEAKAKLELQSTGDERIARSLQDSVAAQDLRLQNYERAQNNLEFVRVELDRIEAKIQALVESSVNQQDPDFLSSQIDSVTETMQSTERAISELQQITGLVDELQEPPAILESDLGKVAGS
jgi:phage terminase Nu1 subunit (DNA packaging protein)